MSPVLGVVLKIRLKNAGGEAQQKSPFKLKSGGNDNINTNVPENKDRDVKPLTKENVKNLENI